MSKFDRTFIFPFKFEIPNYSQVFLDKKSKLHCFIKFLKRNFYIFLRKQNKLELYRITEAHNNILWINLSAPSLGDSLMDLSSRLLLNGKRVDLYTDRKNAPLYKDDYIFTKVYSQDSNVENYKYDIVIIDSYSTRSMKVKSKIAPLVNYVGMYGYFNGPEVNRVLFSFHQMNNLLGYIYSEGEINSFAKCSISISKNDKNIIKNLDLPNSYISIAVGGDWNYRTYKKWDRVISELFNKCLDLNIVLVGSDNAKDEAEKLLKKFKEKQIFNCVAKYSFNQTAEIINQADLLICCDGGLMHVANALNTKIVPLFAKLTPEMQLTSSIKASPLYDPKNVNNISEQNVMKKFMQCY